MLPYHLERSLQASHSCGFLCLATWHQGNPSGLNAADLSKWLPLVASTYVACPLYTVNRDVWHITDQWTWQSQITKGLDSYIAVIYYDDGCFLLRFFFSFLCNKRFFLHNLGRVTMYCLMDATLLELFLYYRSLHKVDRGFWKIINLNKALSEGMWYKVSVFESQIFEIFWSFSQGYPIFYQLLTQLTCYHQLNVIGDLCVSHVSCGIIFVDINRI